MRAHMPIMAFGYRIDEDIRTYREDGAISVVIQIPWGLIAPHEEQAQKNHGQSLSRLAERGGLGADEALAIIEDRKHRPMAKADANARLANYVSSFRAARPSPAREG